MSAPNPPAETNNSPKSQAIDTTADTSQAQQPPPPNTSTIGRTRAERRGGRGLAVLALLISLAAAAGSGYLWYRVEIVQKLEQGSARTQLTAELKAVDLRLKQLQTQQTALTQQQQTLQQSLQQEVQSRLNAMQQRQRELTSSMEKVYAELNRSLDSWALEEVEQLLRIANHSLLLSADIDTAVAALELADGRLQDLGDPGLLTVRQHIAQEITQLKAVERVDVPGLSLRLSAMNEAVAKLPLVSEPQRSLTPQKTAAAVSDDWLSRGRELLTGIADLIRIQNLAKPVQPLLTPEQRYFLIANLRLMISGAQLAGLRGDRNTFQTNLSQARKWLAKYYDTDDRRVSEMISELEGMAHKPLNPPLPTITASLVALQQAKNQQTQ